MRRLMALGLVIACVLASSALADDAKVSGELRKWHRVTLTFDGPSTSETADSNPFLNYRLTVTFSGPGDATFRVPGYFAADGDAADSGADSGNKWRVHFTPNRAGRWQWTASFRAGPKVALSTDPDAGKPAAFDGAGEYEVTVGDVTMDIIARDTQFDPADILGGASGLLAGRLPTIEVEYTDEALRSMRRAERQVIDETKTEIARRY